MKIAVDFDGTIVDHKYPEIGEEKPFAIETLIKLQSDGHKVILWSVREGQQLDDAVNFCKERGLEFYAVNSDNQTGALFKKVETRKLRADLYIDDRNLGGIPDWDVIYEMITGIHTERQGQRAKKQRRGLFGRRR